MDFQCSMYRGFSDIAYLMEFHEFEDSVRDTLRAACISAFAYPTIKPELV